MATELLRIGIAGCGLAARVHLERLLSLESVRVVGCADPDRAAAEALAARVPPPAGAAEPASLAWVDHRELIRQTAPDALAIFAPHLAHYRVAMDALQAGCHIFIEKPLSTNVQEAADIVALARAKPQGRCWPPVSTPAESGRGAATTRGRCDRAAAPGDGDPGRNPGWPLTRGPKAHGGSPPGSSTEASSPMPATTCSTPCSGPPARWPSRRRPCRGGASRVSIS